MYEKVKKNFRGSLKYIFPWLKLKEANLKWYKRLLIYSEVMIAVVMFIWILWIFFGLKMTFNHIYPYNHLHFRTVMPLDIQEENSLHEILTQIENKLKKVDIDFQELQADIFIEKGDVLFTLSLIPGMQLINFASAITIGKNIFIPNSDIKQNQFMLQAYKDNETGLLSEVLAHELVHIWQNKKYGNTIFSQWFKPKWVMEGYAVYSSEREKVLNKPKEKIKHFLEKSKALSAHIRQDGAYILWGLMIQHAIEHMHKSVDDLHLGKVSYDEVMESLLNEYNISKK